MTAGRSLRGHGSPVELSQNQTAPPQRIDLQRAAILLDVDGTLLDIASTPSAIRVPPSLIHSLTRLQKRTRGALALISGRPLAELDRIFAPLKVPAIGGHGAELRPHDNGDSEERQVDSLDGRLRTHLMNIAKVAPGILIEDKGYAIALHYRRSPKLERMLHKEVAAICAKLAPAGVKVLCGKAVVEIKSGRFNKGTALRELMAQSPFRGRQPIFVGDDITDDDVFAVLPEFNGIGFSVGKASQGAVFTFASPREVRAWLDHLIDRDETATS